MENEIMYKDKQDIHELYEKSVAFHGHICPGLAIGVRAAYEAKKILGVSFSKNEEVVCVTENDACGVDGIQVVLGCTAGKGNLIFRIRGKHAYSFFNRKNGQSIRIVQKNLQNMGREERIRYVLYEPFDKVFTKGEPTYGLPSAAQIYDSVDCEVCGENTAEPYIRLQNGKKICIDCYDKALEGSVKD